MRLPRPFLGPQPSPASHSPSNVAASSCAVNRRALPQIYTRSLSRTFCRHRGSTPSTAMSLAPSSPRLPSPPPAAEIQIGPKSPSGGPAASPQTTPQEQTQLDASSRRRIHPGTKAADMAAGPPLIPLHEVCCAHADLS